MCIARLRGRYVDDLSVFDGSEKKTKQVFDRMDILIVRKRLPPKPPKCRFPKNNSLTVLEVVFRRTGGIEMDTEKMNNFLHAIAQFLKVLVMNTARLQPVLLFCN